METLWFWIVALMLTAYVVLDGFDIGAGIIHLFVARTDAERRKVLASIGPVWDGNEVWLLAAGGTLYFAFPALYASSFSGFYLPLMIVLWLLILRGISIEFRNHIADKIWQPLWDAVFCSASALLAIFFGAALGNVVRGVPLDKEGFFFLPLWTSLMPEADAGIIDWYTVLIGVTALVALAVHGALWVANKTDGDLQMRCRRVASAGWWLTVAMSLVISIASFRVQPHLAESLAARPWGFAFVLLAIASLLAVKWTIHQRKDFFAFLASCGFLLGALASAAIGLYPYVLPSNKNAADGLTIYNTAAAPYGLGIGLAWWTPALCLAVAYFVYTYRRFAGKVILDGRP